MKTSRGFTLLEIMIAVAVFAIVAAALTRSAVLTVRQTGIIEDRTVAYWIAENEANRLRLDRDSISRAGSDRFPVLMAKREWEVRININDTQNQDVRRAEINVYREDDLERPVAILSTFLGKH